MLDFEEHSVCLLFGGGRKSLIDCCQQYLIIMYSRWKVMHVRHLESSDSKQLTQISVFWKPIFKNDERMHSEIFH